MCVTLPTKTWNPRSSLAVASLNRVLSNVLPKNGCLTLNINPDLAPKGVLLERFTTDGVHLTRDAYRVWADKLKPLVLN